MNDEPQSATDYDDRTSAAATKDGSVAIIKRYADRLAGWQSVRDRGQSDAIRQGFAQLPGDGSDLMAWLNSDDLLAPRRDGLDLDIDAIAWLEDLLIDFKGSVIAITHDRAFLDRIATHILAAEGDSQWVFFDGNYQEYEADKKKRLGEEGAKPKRVRFKALK